MRIAIIGGRGFLGTRLQRRLTDAGHEVIVLDIAHPDIHRRVDVSNISQVTESTIGVDAIVNLAAVHRDDVRPRSAYDTVNVAGAANICEAAQRNGIRKIVFTSSVAVYGLGQHNADEDAPIRHFDAYGRTKAEAERVYRDWQAASRVRSLVIVRPAVIFGEGNRGNVYNLLAQIAAGHFIMIGDGRNIKSLAYVENVAAFLVYAMSSRPGIHVYNYADKPDLSVNEIVAIADRVLFGAPKRRLRIPYWLGYAGGRLFDFAGAVSGKAFRVSSVRIKKFCSDTRFAADRAQQTGFSSPMELRKALEATVRHEFLEPLRHRRVRLTE